jgi:regulatory protein
LGLLSRRELSAAQLCQRLARRGFASDEIARTIERLTADRTVDDHRVARAYARTEAAIKGRGRRRVLHAIQRLGIAPEVAETAVADVYGDLDEDALFQRALDKRLKGASIDALDDKARSRVIRHLVAQGFPLSRILHALRG